MNKIEYGKKIKDFIFEGFYTKKNMKKSKLKFIVCKNGLLIKDLNDKDSFFIKWNDMISVSRICGDVEKIEINIDNIDEKVIVYNKKDSEEFYDTVSKQIEKHRYYEILREIKIDLEDLSLIMDTNGFENDAYLDTLTGNIIHIPCELKEDNIYDEEYVKSLPKWEKEIIDDAKEIYEDFQDRYVEIPEKENYNEYYSMLDFTRELKDDEIKDKLFDALDGKGAFRRFKNLLRNYPKINEKWYEYKQNEEKEKVKEWLYSIGIDPIEK